jgi:amidase
VTIFLQRAVPLVLQRNTGHLAGMIIVGLIGFPVALAFTTTVWARALHNNTQAASIARAWDKASKDLAARKAGAATAGAATAGGSARLPAHFCGVCGLKPTENRVPLSGHIPNLPGAVRTVRIMGALGPLARSVADLRLALDVLAGGNSEDTQVPPVPIRPPATELQNLQGLHVACVQAFPGTRVAPAMADAVGRVATALAQQGTVAEDTPPPQWTTTPKTLCSKP